MQLDGNETKEINNPHGSDETVKELYMVDA